MGPWDDDQGKRAFRKLLELTVSHGTRDEQAVARDILDGRLKETDVLYMPDASGKATASLHALARKWDNLPEEERATAMQDPERAVRAIIDSVDSHDIGPAEPEHESTRPDDIDDDEDFSKINWVRRSQE